MTEFQDLEGALQLFDMKKIRSELGVIVVAIALNLLDYKLGVPFN
jgi:hypothetical protein